MLLHWAPYVVWAAAYTVLRYSGYGLLALLVFVGGVALLAGEAFTNTPRWGHVEGRRRARLRDAIERSARESRGAVRR